MSLQVSKFASNPKINIQFVLALLNLEMEFWYVMGDTGNQNA